MINEDKNNWMISDLHIHSRFSRACSKELNLNNLSKWGKIKGLDLIGTGDFTHNEWFNEIKNELENNGKGFYIHKKTGFKFLLSGEISLIYTQNGKGRKVHLVLLAPSIEVVENIHKYLDNKGFRRDYDGRPIFGISCENFTRDMKNISNDIEIIPAHCLPGDSILHVNHSLKKIKDIKEGDLVFTHKNRWREVKQVFSRKHIGKMYHIKPWYWTKGLETTPEHPFYAIKSYNCSWIKGLCKKSCSKLDSCKNKRFEKYAPKWIPASELDKGDFLIYPRFKCLKDINLIDIGEFVNNYKLFKDDYILSKFARNNKGFVKKKININKDFCRLVGYYLAEGYIIRDRGIGFSFNSNEKDYIMDVISLIKRVFGLDNFKIDSGRDGQKDLIFVSKILNSFFRNLYDSDTKKSYTKAIPDFLLDISLDKQVNLFKGWYKGDKGYTTSRKLMNQMKIICLRLGIIPNIHVNSTKERYEKRGKHFIDGRKIIANHDLYSLGNLSFFEDKFDLLSEKEFKKFNTKRSRRHGWIDKEYIYLPIRRIEIKDYNDYVYNLEVEDDNSYVTEFSCVHNCWTPYFGVFGSMSGFDSLTEAFGSQSDGIYSIETGISSDPKMNYKIKELQNKTILSFSDSHSFWPYRLGREATIFRKTYSYKELIRQIRENDIIGTIETEPAYGKYHWDGHSSCNFSCSPEKTKELNGICPKCNKPLTLGVDYRVERLSNNKKINNKKPFFTILPLHEIIALYFDCGLNTKKVWNVYNELIQRFKNEFNILLHVSEDELNNCGIDNKLVELILKNRKGKISVQPGYDGEYGKALIGNVKKEE